MDEVVGKLMEEKVRQRDETKRKNRCYSSFIGTAVKMDRSGAVRAKLKFRIVL